MNLIEFANKVKAINIEDLMDSAVLAEKEAILDANTEQLSLGVDSTGDYFGEYRSKDYAEFKQSIGSKAPMGIVDLKLTGDFHSGFFITKQSDGFTISSKDEKTAELRAKYGPDIFGLSETAKNEVREPVSFRFLKLLRDALL